jgi:hypothetical protein
MKSPIRYLIENSTKSLCQPQDSDNFCLLDLLRFCLFCATFSDNLVKVNHGRPVAHLIVTRSHFVEMQTGSSST